MAKRPTKEEGLFPEAENIAALLTKKSKQDIVVLTIPSHDKRNKELPEPLVAEWASNAMKLMADLYRGATAYKAFSGIFKTDEGHYLLDKPILIESFATVEAIQDRKNLNVLVEFCKRMGKTLEQQSIMLVFGGVMYYIEDYSGV
jgi:hypothetical protein